MGKLFTLFFLLCLTACSFIAPAAQAAPQNGTLPVPATPEGAQKAPDLVTATSTRHGKLTFVEFFSVS
jgi:hypothetical protein